MKIYYASALLALFLITIPLHLACMHEMTVQKIDNNQHIILAAPGDQPRCGAWISNTKIIVSGTTQCAFIDLDSQPTKITSFAIQPLHIAVNTDKSLCAVSEPYALTVYDTKTCKPCYILSFDTSHNRPIAFCPKNPLHLFYRQNTVLKGIEIPNESGKSAKNFFQKYVNNQSTPLHLVSHPTQEKNFLECGSINYESLTKCYSHEHASPDITNITDHMYALVADSAEYNGDGSIIAIRSIIGNVYLVKNNTAEGFYSSTLPCQGIKFHLNKIVLALLTSNNTIEYWNCLTKSKIAETSNNELNWLHNSNESHSTQRLSISPNGTRILGALQNQCRDLPIPFDAIFQGDTRKQALAAFLSLQKYAKQYAQENNLPDNALPQDIINLILQIYWNCDYVSTK